MTYKELIKKAAPLTLAEVNTLEQWVGENLHGYEVHELDIPQDIRLLLWRHTNALKANARWLRLKSTVMHYLAMFRNGDFTTLLLKEIKIKTSDCTVPDGMMRLAALIIYAHSYVMLVRGVTDEQAEAIGKFGGDETPRPLSVRSQNFRAKVAPKSSGKSALAKTRGTFGRNRERR